MLWQSARFFVSRPFVKLSQRALVNLTLGNTQTTRQFSQQNRNMRLPIGISDFRKMVDQQPSQKPYVFADKSLLIKDIINTGSAVTLITRPSGFGKTLNMSMLHHFFSKYVDGQPTQGLFDTLKIAQSGEDYMQEQGQYPVIFLTLKDVKESSFQQAMQKMQIILSNLFKQYAFLLDSPKLIGAQKKRFDLILERKADKVTLEYSLSQLTKYLTLHYGRNPYLLIDEYDTPIQYACEQNYYQEMNQFMLCFLGDGLKDNSYLHKAVLTGILRISQESALNHLDPYSVLDSKYGEYFGFTTEEVVNLQQQTASKIDLSDIAHWYNGYQIGEHIMYNPCSIIHCLSHQELRPYWINTSENALIGDLMTQSNARVVQDIKKLLKGETIEKNIDPNMNISTLVLTEIGLWTLLLMSGYLKPITQCNVDCLILCQLAIPNREVMELFKTMIKQWLSGNAAIPEEDNFLMALLAGDIDAFKGKWNAFMLQAVNVPDHYAEQAYFYHTFMLGIMVFIDKNCYEIRSNHEIGHGRYDVVIASRENQHLSVILSFNTVETNGTKARERRMLLDKAAQTGLQQIDDKGYEAELHQQGTTNILKVGMAFSGNHVSIDSNIDDVKLTSNAVSKISP